MTAGLLVRPTTMPTLQTWKDWMEVLVNLAIVAGALIGGTWTLFTFRSLRLRSRALGELANVELDEKRKRLELATLELDNRRQAVINIDLKAKQVQIPGQPDYYVEVVASIVNVGDANALLVFPSAPLIVTEAIVTPCTPMWTGMRCAVPPAKHCAFGGWPAR